MVTTYFEPCGVGSSTKCTKYMVRTCNGHETIQVQIERHLHNESKDKGHRRDIGFFEYGEILRIVRIIGRQSKMASCGHLHGFFHIVGSVRRPTSRRLHIIWVHNGVHGCVVRKVAWYWTMYLDWNGQMEKE